VYGSTKSYGSALPGHVAKLVDSTRMGQQIVYELNMSVFQEVVEHLYSWLKPGTP
jgi:hypothetical protein